MVLPCQLISFLSLFHLSTFIQKPKTALSVTHKLTDVQDTDTTKPRCEDVYVLFARGTDEPRPLGTIVGEPLKAAVSELLAARGVTVRFWGVDYPARLLDFLHGGYGEGGKIVSGMVRRVMGVCPGSDIVLAGYSQGAQLTHDGAFQLTYLERQRIAAVVTFGDPFSNNPLPLPLESRRMTFCNDGDRICAADYFSVSASHYAYGQNTTAAAIFIGGRVRRRGLGGAKALVRSKL